MSKSRKKKAKMFQVESSEASSAVEQRDYVDRIAICQKVMKALTVTIMGAIIFIIALTTFSTGFFVQVVGKGLYYVMLASALASLGTWIHRTRLQKRLGQAANVPAETTTTL